MKLKLLIAVIIVPSFFFLTFPAAAQEYQVPSATIAIDGDVSDWQGIVPAIQDPSGDKSGAITGTDITNVYLARDNRYFYVRFDLADGPANTDSQTPVYYSMGFLSAAAQPFRRRPLHPRLFLSGLPAKSGNS